MIEDCNDELEVQEKNLLPGELSIAFNVIIRLDRMIQT
jgi:hypothetical protein